MPSPSWGRASLRALLFLAMTGGLVCLYFLLTPVSLRARAALPRVWYRSALALTRIRVDIVGAPTAARPAMFVANHISYLDIPILGALIDARFVAKREVAGWPLFGYLARLIGTVFIGRMNAEVSLQRASLRQCFDAGDRLVLFPEGTSSDGRSVLPFKSPLFAIAKDGGAMDSLAIQPVTVAYRRHADGRPLTGDSRALYAWYGDMTLAPHLFQVFGLEGVNVEVIFHDVVTGAQFQDRKSLARYCERRVAAGLTAASGRQLISARTF